ncbi:hypothetical protein [Aquipuribacter sp. MA13-6]|uniref:hypothetical protein n=1 Tax=unclassified Aquipuribacter TaxID=2635084 RepID=UPI003EE8BF51
MMRVEYLRWNAAVADVLYPELTETSPAYLDIEADALGKMAADVGCPPERARDALVEAVREAALPDGRCDFRGLARELARWRRDDRLGPPPVLAFLAVTVMAAEEMGRSDGDLPPHAYYARLARILGLPDVDERLKAHYRSHAEEFWSAVNGWLERLDGRRGLPTAYALSHRYVSLPISQALVNRGDRARLPLVFDDLGLAAGMRLSTSDIERHLEQYLASSHPILSSAFRRLWTRAASRERLASLVSVELAHWDGTLPGTSEIRSQGRRALLVVDVRRTFRGASVDIGMAMRAGSDFDGQATALAEDASWVPVTLVPATAGLWRTMSGAGIDVSSLLDSVVRLRADGEVEFTHRPRSIVPLVYDELQASFVEQERAQLAADSVLLVRTEGGSLVLDRVRRVLESCARPGWDVVEGTGVPHGWVLVEGVQLFASPADAAPQELVPMSSTQLTLAGGVRIPSRVRKWVVSAPPEARAVAEAGGEVHVVLRERDSQAELHRWAGDGGVLVAPLGEAGLEQGDYDLELYTALKSAPVQRVSVRLRSADEPDAGFEDVAALVYSTGSTAAGALSATPFHEEADTVYVDGSVAAGAINLDLEPLVAPRGAPWATRESAVPARPVVRLGSVDPTSCVVTGAHRFELPDFHGGRAQRYVEGQCSSCGLVKRWPGWLRWGQTQQASARVAEGVSVADLPPASIDRVYDWPAALGALGHLGGGSIRQLEAVATQLEGTPLFVGQFIRAIEALGHVDIQRDSRLVPVRWAVAGTAVAEDSTGRWHLTGYWPDSLVHDVGVAAAAAGGLLSFLERGEDPGGWVLTGLPEDALQGVLPEDVSVAPDAGSAVAKTLPPLSQVAAALERIPMPGYDEASRFDVPAASWVLVHDTSGPGAYRLRRGYETVDLFRDEADVRAGTACRVDVYLAKHLAANLEGTVLFAHLRASEQLVLPRGCQLPGLYGRSVALASGALGVESRLSSGTRRHCHRYADVPAGLADHLATVMSN